MVTLACEGLAVTLGGRIVLDAASAAFAPGGLVGVVGPNGAGKSTLVRALAGLLPVARGRATLDGRDVAAIPRAEMARRIAYLPQGQTLHWPLSVARLVALGRLPHLAPFQRIGAGDAAAIDRAMALTEVTDLRDRVATELSGGERARVLLARALAVEAPVLIVDEPLAALDPGHQLDMMALLRARAGEGALVIAVLHDLGLAARQCDRLLLLHAGRVVADGAPADVLTAERLAAIFGIRAWTGMVEGQPILVPLHRSS
ncbi:ABC transporter ATP-binding protein [Sphingomonas quercus]|uniref:ABC transporter ATP-binding protein n=1 Tax=Sphingomonas quercus TaxID=2842451 RepID=A0ABS6BK62_9SPHN|nr:ABC transporter ATP-binding protein [Sphingomonas quercus]MBU3078693.1 ABC transporter ATP-binding protein [Sphingomonas quercus]